MPSSLQTPLTCATVKDMLPAFLSQKLDIELHGRIEGHLCACDACAKAYSELAMSKYETEKLPKPFISVFPENLEVKQLPLRYAASTEKDEKGEEFFEHVENEFTITIWQPKDEQTAVVGINIADDFREKYEGKHVRVGCDDKKILLLKGRIVDGHLSDNSPKTFSEIIEKFPLLWGFKD